MEDPIRLGTERFRAIYSESFQVWSGLHQSATRNSGLPVAHLAVPNAFRQHPSFPPGLRLKHTKYAKHSQVYATGSSTWDATQARCEHELPSFQQSLQIEVASSKPIPLTIAETPTSKCDVHSASWFARSDQNYISVLALAWAYVLSARWTELMPEPCSLRYTSSQAGDGDQEGITTNQGSGHFSVSIDIRDTSQEEARWWAAVLAPGQGWQATMTMEETAFWSPWSIQLKSGPRFSLSAGALPIISPLSSATAASFSGALRFLERFCIRRNITDQSHAALAAVLLFPGMSSNDRVLHLPAPTNILAPASQQSTNSEFGLRHDWVHQDNHLDKLITLSCNIRGIRPMLLSFFYEPAIECNAVTPWLQGAMAAIDSLAIDNPLVLGRMFMDRLPQVAFLWLGATVLGLQKKLLQNVRYGLIPLDLHSAAWSGTIQSFIQLPVSDPPVVDGGVSRADQCRLLFLSRSGSHDRVPFVQWKPFGATPLADADVEIRLHVECKGHGLQYQGFSWDCTDGTAVSQPAEGVNAYKYPSPLIPSPLENLKQTLVFYGVLNREDECVSENATRNIFSWLRVEGYAPDERRIWEHEWFKILDSDSEDDGQSKESHQNASNSSLVPQ